MKKLFARWLSALLIATLLLSCSALTEEELPVTEAPVEVFAAEPVEDAAVPEEAVELSEAEALPDFETDAAEEVVEQEQPAEAAKLMEGEEFMPIDEAHFPDPVFRQYVSDLFDLDGDGSFTQAERELVFFIGGWQRVDYRGVMDGFYLEDGRYGKVVWSRGVTSLQGVEYFPNLKKIDCTHNPIASLDVSMLKQLEILFCGDCGMTSLNVAGCTGLKEISVSNNALTSLDLTGCSYFDGFPTGFKTDTDLLKGTGAVKLKGSEPSANEIGIFLICDKNVNINGLGPAISFATTAASTSFTEVPGAANAAVTVAASSTAANTKAAVVAAPGAKTQLESDGAKSFKSSNKKVATVSKKGVVTFKKAGKVKITYKVGKKTRKVTLTVTDPTLPTGVTIAPVTTEVKKGDSVTLTATLSEGANSGIKWTSSNKKVATVNKSGTVTFKKAGKVTITATTTRGKKKARVTFTVSN